MANKNDYWTWKIVQGCQHWYLYYLQRRGWMGYLQRTEDARNTKKMYQVNWHQKRPKRRLKAGRKNGVQNGIRKMGIANRRQVAQDRDRWRRATRETLVLFWIAQPQKNTTTAAAATTTTTSSSSSSCGPCSSFDVVLYITCTVCNIYSISNLEKNRTHTHTHTHTHIYIYMSRNTGSRILLALFVARWCQLQKNTVCASITKLYIHIHIVFLRYN